MTKLKVLYADDHIPDRDFPDEKDQIKELLKKRHPGWSDDNTTEWVDCYYYARQVIKMLYDSDYDVQTANKYQEAMELAEHSHFDIAIIDLGWYNDNTLPPPIRQKEGVAGWDICEKIEDADKKGQSQPTLQIVYSHRFVTRSDLSTTAAEKGALPFFKTYQDTNTAALRAVVEFLKRHLATRSPEEQFAIRDAKVLGDFITNSLQASQTQQRQWSILTLIFVAVSLILILAGAISAMFWNIGVGTITSISSIVTGAISSLLFVQLQRSRKEVEKDRKEAIARYECALIKLGSNASKPAGETGSSNPASSEDAL